MQVRKVNRILYIFHMLYVLNSYVNKTIIYNVSLNHLFVFDSFIYRKHCFWGSCQ